MFIEKIKPAKNVQENIYNSIKATGNPVIDFGAGEVAGLVGNLLEEHGISVPTQD